MSRVKVEDSLSENPVRGPRALLHCLPPETLRRTMSFADPVAILSLGKTCKAFRTMTQERDFWLKAATKLCIDLGLFEPSFPLATKDMSVRDLQHLVTSPSRVETWASKNNESPEVPLHWTRTFTPRPSRSENALSIHGLELVPGGRYLITFTKRKGVYLWDLGFNATVTHKLVPVAQLSIQCNFSWWPSCPTEDRKGIQIQVCRFWQDSKFTLEVYEVYPEKQTPQFHHTLSFPLKKEPQILAHSHYALACTVEGSQDVQLIYTKAPKVQGTPPSQSINLGLEVFDITLFESCLVAFTAGKALVFEIPKYCQHGAPPGSTISVSPPRITLWQPSRDDMDSLTTDGWKAPALEHLLCPLLTQDDIPTLRLYQVTGVPSSGSDAFPSKIPVESGECKFVTGKRGRNVNTFCCASSRVWRSANHFYVLAKNSFPALILLKYKIPQKQFSSTLERPSMVHLTGRRYACLERFLPVSSMCFATGRLVIAMPLGDDDGDAKHEIHIIDYFAPL
ncbi:hypothetical protein BKA70DRAFT_1393919 [Coprinopsis sp. MPI-PUGE-AT-0042]|nr:hypothetical protein BKA70DRAFT_1393919 [Coprinopsis sp. MPI-PUGE-AT-0042]